MVETGEWVFSPSDEWFKAEHGYATLAECLAAGFADEKTDILFVGYAERVDLRDHVPSTTVFIELINDSLREVAGIDADYVGDQVSYLAEKNLKEDLMKCVERWAEENSVYQGMFSVPAPRMVGRQESEREILERWKREDERDLARRAALRASFPPSPVHPSCDCTIVEG